MKTIFIIILLNFYPILDGFSQTVQTRWKILTFSSDYVIYYDTKTISFQNNIKVWLKWIPWESSLEKVIEKLKDNSFDKEKFDNFSYQLQYWEVDCSKKRYLIIEYAYYSNEGQIIESYSFENPKWNNVFPETVGENILIAICKLKQEK